MFSNVVDEAIKVNLKNREIHRPIKSVFSSFNYMKEFCTVKIDIGRAVGKTKYIIDHIESNDILFCHMYASKDSVQSVNHHKDIHIFVNAEKDSQELIDYFMNRKSTSMTIWIDEPKLALKKFEDMYDFYRMFSHIKDDITFVFLGE